MLFCPDVECECEWRLMMLIHVFSGFDMSQWNTWEHLEKYVPVISYLILVKSLNQWHMYQ